MFGSKLKYSALLIAGVACLTPTIARADDKEPARKPTASKLDLSPQSMPGLLALVRPQETEWRHLQVQWMTDVVAARKLAMKDDKPIVILYTGGAGYNEPLGIC